MNTETFSPDDLDELAVFPLPGVVLFPGAALPLHIFEPRYRQMTRDVMAGSNLIAMVRVADAHQGMPTILGVAGLGKVHATRELDDGRFIVILHGVARVRIDRELKTTKDYRIASATHLPELAPDVPSVAIACEAQLVKMCDRLADSVEDGAKLREVLRLAEDPGSFADLAASFLIRDASHRQQLLETRDPCARLDRIILHLSETMIDAGLDRELN